MTTQITPYSRIIAVWLVLAVFLCGILIPGSAIAKKEMAIATEGDPGDGMDNSGGGGGTLDGGDNNQGFEIIGPDQWYFVSQASLFEYQGKIFNEPSQFIISLWINGQLHFVVVEQIGDWGANR